MSTHLIHEPYTFLSITTFQLHINPMECVYFVGCIVSHVQSRNNAIHINLFAIDVIIFEFVMAQM